MSVLSQFLGEVVHSNYHQVESTQLQRKYPIQNCQNICERISLTDFQVSRTVRPKRKLFKDPCVQLQDSVEISLDPKEFPFLDDAAHSFNGTSQKLRDLVTESGRRKDPFPGITIQPSFEQKRSQDGTQKIIDCDSTLSLQENLIEHEQISTHLENRKSQEMQLLQFQTGTEDCEGDQTVMGENQFCQDKRRCKDLLAQNNSLADQEDLYMPLNYKLLKTRHTNQQRRAAELVCAFLGIDSERTVSLHDIIVQSILEEGKDKKNEYTILLGRRRKNCTIFSINHPEYNIFVACTKFQGFQTLIRIELTYGKIYGFVTNYYQEISDIPQTKPRLAKGQFKRSHLFDA